MRGPRAPLPDRVLAVALLVGSACATGTTWSRPGGTEPERRNDETECAAPANRDRLVPMIARGPTVGAERIELGTQRRFDVQAYDDCMKDRGYRRVPGTAAGGS